MVKFVWCVGFPCHLAKFTYVGRRSKGGHGVIVVQARVASQYCCIWRLGLRYFAMSRRKNALR